MTINYLNKGKDYLITLAIQVAGATLFSQSDPRVLTLSLVAQSIFCSFNEVIISQLNKSKNLNLPLPNKYLVNIGGGAFGYGIAKLVGYEPSIFSIVCATGIRFSINAIKIIKNRRQEIDSKNDSLKYIDKQIKDVFFDQLGYNQSFIEDFRSRSREKTLHPPRDTRVFKGGMLNRDCYIRFGLGDIFDSLIVEMNYAEKMSKEKSDTVPKLYLI